MYRRGLLELMDACTAMPLTLVTGPAGTGKTSLVAMWAAESTWPTAWLSLDEGDHDATNFWTSVAAALETLLHEELPHSLNLRQRPGFVDDAVFDLLDDLDALDRPPSSLVIDNIHLIDDDSLAASSLAVFVQHLPKWLHVVLLARRAPQLPLARMRARGELGEVGYADLRFLDDEAGEMLRRFAPGLSDDRITEIVARADGWAAGIQLGGLAARSTRNGRDERSSGREDLFVSDYVWQEVLAAERPELVDALLDMAVVERVNVNLAATLTGRTDPHALLSEAEHRGLFVTRLGSSDWYEIHSLVRERLRSELVRRSPSHAADLYTRAAQWFEEAGEIALALDQWILANQPRQALRVLAAKCTALYDAGREATIIRTIARLPNSVAQDDLDAAVELAWSNLLVSRDTFLQMVDRATRWAGQLSNLSPTVRIRLTMLQSIAATAQGDWSRGGELARLALTELGDSWPTDLLGRFGWNMVARDIALSEGWRTSEEIRCLQHEVSRDPERRLTYEGTRALGEALAGRPVDALRIASGIRQAAAVTSMSILRLELAAAEAIAHRELADRPRAEAEFGALEVLPTFPVIYVTLLGELELTQMRLDEGDIGRAEAAFSRAVELVESELGGSGARSWLGRVGTRVALTNGDLAQARRWSSTINDAFWGPISEARIQLMIGDHPGALRFSDQAAARCPRHEVVRGLLRSRALTGRDESVEQAGSAAGLASTYGLVQTVASEGPECLRLIELAAWRVPTDWLDRVRRATTGIGSARLVSLGLIESLTDREREVLRLLPSRLTLHEIADELFISINTLKFHLKVIYRKLGCASRAEAVAISQQTTHSLRVGQLSEILRR
jgi:LuxR family maltose regulon positive regulatory protein